NVYQVTLPVVDGEVTILPKHRSYIAALKPGEIIYKKNKGSKEEENLAIAGGFVEFHKNRLVVLSDEAARADEIDLEKAEEARKRAEDLKNRVIQGAEGEFAHVAATLERELVKIRVAKKYISRRGF
ncbi:MAG: ATP synthase F1 subunit epsilon, partial [Candidatus Moranbacteria bacterium]|nr:ATP synthase F1 subunit epsilon [Candidatus Moranbacteria bacterium]